MKKLTLTLMAIAVSVTVFAQSVETLLTIKLSERQAKSLDAILVKANEQRRENGDTEMNRDQYAQWVLVGIISNYDKQSGQEEGQNLLGAWRYASEENKQKVKELLGIN